MKEDFNMFSRALLSPRRLLGAAALAVLAADIASAASAPRNPLNGRQSYSGSNMSCLIANDFYAVHFTAIQPGRMQGETTDFAKYCQEIPVVGKTFLTVDLLDRDTRATPIALRVIEEEFSEDDGRPPKEVAQLAQTPAKIYRNGSADIPADLSRPGHYALIVTIGEEQISEDDRLRIPFTVAIENPAKVNWLSRFAGLLAASFFGVMALIGYRAYRIYGPKKKAPPVAAGASVNSEIG
jgi:hypothetical protein